MKPLYLFTVVLITVGMAGVLWIGLNERFHKQHTVMFGIGWLLMTLLFIMLYKRRSVTLKRDRVRIQFIEE